jgi:hypothetical protein
MTYGFEQFDENVRSIVTNKPDAWEFLLTAALMKRLLRAPLRRWEDLKSGVLVSPRDRLSDEQVMDWLVLRLDEAQDVAKSLTRLYGRELQKSWGEPGFPGDALEIRDVILNMARTCELAVDWESKIKFTQTSEIYNGLMDTLSGAVGHNLPKLLEAANVLELGLKKHLENPDQPMRISHTIIFDLPENWEYRIEAEIELIKQSFGWTG